MTVRDLIDLLESHGRLDDEVVMRCEVTSSNTHVVTRGTAATTDDTKHPDYVFVLSADSGVDRGLYQG